MRRDFYASHAGPFAIGGYGNVGRARALLDHQRIDASQSYRGDGRCRGDRRARSIVMRHSRNSEDCPLSGRSECGSMWTVCIRSSCHSRRHGQVGPWIHRPGTTCSPTEATQRDIWTGRLSASDGAVGLVAAVSACLPKTWRRTTRGGRGALRSNRPTTLRFPRSVARSEVTMRIRIDPVRCDAYGFCAELLPEATRWTSGATRSSMLDHFPPNSSPWPGGPFVTAPVEPLP